MSENKNSNSENSKHETIELHDLLIKQHSLLLQQYETMAKLQQQQNEKEDEIDLSRLIPKFLRKKDESITKEKIVHEGKVVSERKVVSEGTKKGLKAFIKLMLNYYTNGIKRFAFIVLLLFILFTSYGVYKYFTADKLYSSQMIIDSGNLDNSFFSGLVDNLGKLAESESSTELARKLDITNEQASLITDFQFEVYEDFDIELQKKTDSTEQILEYPFFTVTATVKDNSVLPILNKQLFAYLNNNPYVKQGRDIEKKILTESISKYQGQISSLDSLKNAVVERVSRKNENNKYWVKESSAAGGGIILSQEQPMEMQPMTPFDKTFGIQKKELAAKKRLLKLDNDFKIIDDFSAVETPVFPRLRHIVAFGIFGFLIGSLIAFFLILFFPKEKKTA